MQQLVQQVILENRASLYCCTLYWRALILEKQKQNKTKKKNTRGIGTVLCNSRVRDRSLFLLEGAGRIWGGSWLFWWAERGGPSVFCSFIFKHGFLCLTMVFLNNLVWVLSNFLRKWVMKLRILGPQIQNFRRQGGASPLQPSPGAGPLDPCEHLLPAPCSQTVLPTSVRKGLKTVGGNESGGGGN